MAKTRVAVLMGGRSAEREVSLSSARQVLSALDPEQYEAIPVDTAHLFAPAGADDAPRGEGELPPLQGFPLTGPRRPDVAFICLHGRFGEDGTIQGLLELLDIPYTGSGVLASALAIDKVMSKRVLRAEGIPTPAWETIRGRAEADRFLAAFDAGQSKVDLPVVVKPSRQGSTIGITIVREPGDMARAIHDALAYDPEVLVEQFVQGVEITGPVLGNEQPRCLPLVEIVPASGFYDYEAKYTPGATEEIVPARIAPDVARAAEELSIRSHVALGCRGFSRTDLIVADKGVWVLEVNTIPGLTPTSLLPRSAQAAGIEFPELIHRMIQLALEGTTCESALVSRG
jgi:D-alanine-D-alanine ligase